MISYLPLVLSRNVLKQIKENLPLLENVRQGGSNQTKNSIQTSPVLQFS